MSEAILEGVELQKEGEVLGPQFGGAFPPSNLIVEIRHSDQLPDARPSRILFAALRDPRLRMIRPIPLDVTVEESTVIVFWAEIDEFGTGETLSSAIDDFAGAIRELYRQLFAADAVLGVGLEKVKGTIAEYILPRK
jgi:hypothetical protein